jgi:pyruvate/2-oxoglutarate dehydrogenase complex dihydrolipoamide dehydrogenase (E3) component
MRQARFDLVVVGLGSAGLVAAEFAARLGLRVAAVEAERPGGDCLWTGCVPSKALIASARAAHALRTADRLGLPAVKPEIDTAAVWRRIRAVQEEIASTDDSPERYEALGVELLRGRARLVGPHAVEVDGRQLETRFVLLCTGSRPAVPPIPGLVEAGFLTSETLWTLERPPRSLVVLGGGPVGCELAQACARLGLRAVLVEMLPRLLPSEEPELAELVAETLRGEGVEVMLGANAERVSAEDGQKTVSTTGGVIAADELLVAVGRTPNVDGLGLEEAGVRIEGGLRTSVKSVYAVGDLAGRYLFTHSAANEAVQAVREMFFPGRGKPAALVPWVTFTDPELAHAGLTVAEAMERHRSVRAWRIELDRSDRARADALTRGRLLLVTARGKLVGAHALVPHAGELIHELALAIHKRLSLDELAGLVHVYPTYSTSVLQLASEAALERANRLRWLRHLTVR